MKKVITLLLGLSLSIISLGQIITSHKISGYVYNLDGEPLVGATIKSTSANVPVVGTVADVEGYFELESESEFYEINYVGYRGKIFSSKDLKDAPLIEMEEIAFNLDEVVVRAYTFPLFRSCCFCGCSERISRGVQKADETIASKKDPFPEKSNNDNWLIYPNPAFNQLNVTSTTKEEGQIQLISPNGQVLKTQNINAINTELNLNQLPGGTYYLRYRNKNSQKLIGTVVKMGLR